MPLAFTRVDDRLIHGQVVQGWLPGIKTDEVVVVLEEADSLAKDLMRLALPPEYGLKVLSAADAAAYVKNSSSRVFLIFESLESFEAALKKGLEVKTVNIGGLHYRDGREKILQDVYLTPPEREFVKKLLGGGVDVDGRAVPAEVRVNLKGML